ncbi:cutinase family protein [Nocardia sp. NPDC058499]|uniref:cutinase family protein n=1 Tax=Nocardia sp. NPDC058499 TaxID=3346530 RepID=UPI0036637CC2
MAGVFVPGTWETTAAADPRQPQGLLAPVATALEQQFGPSFHAVFPAYAAKAMDGMLYGDSQAQGVAAARTVVADIAARCRATKFVLAGYSQGADAAGDLASAIGCHNDPVPAQRILAVGLVADPKQGTTGGKLVGPALDGNGIRGTRPDGFCRLGAVTAQLCEPTDRYCATDAATHPILAGLGQVLSQPSGAPTSRSSGQASSSGDSPGSGTSVELTRSLDAGFSAAALAGLPVDIDALSRQVGSGDLSGDGLAATAASVGTVLTKIGDLARWAGTDPTVTRRLSEAAPGSPDQHAGRVLDTVQQLDLGAAANAAAVLADQLHRPSGPTTPALTQALDTLASSTSALTTLGSDVLSQASTVLSLLKPATLIDQITVVATNTVGFAANVPAILDTARRIGTAVTDPGTDIAGKVRAVHDIFRTLNDLCQPLVRLAAGIDLSLVAPLLRMIPDPTGTAQIASLVLSLLSNLDVIGLARQVGTLQQNLWHIVETLTGGGDLIAIGAAFAELIPTLLGFASLAVNTLTGTASTTDPALLHTPTSAVGQTRDLAGIAEVLLDAATSQGATDLAQLVGEGLDAAQFFTSGAHQGYDNYIVDSAGRTALDWLTDWFTNRIRQVGL